MVPLAHRVLTVDSGAKGSLEPWWDLQVIKAKTLNKEQF